jgi:hypothetical protein
VVSDASCPQGSSSVVRVLIGNAPVEARVVEARGVFGWRMRLEDRRGNPKVSSLVEVHFCACFLSA